jgi:hypothetical protein
MKKVLNILAVRIDGGTQPRASINLDAVNEYAEAITSGASLPPPTVFHDGADYWLADGFHRYHANKKIGAVSLECEVIEGTQRDAVLYSLSANQTHGLRRSNEDKRKAVMTMLNDPDWAQWSNNQIAKKCGVSLDLVNRSRLSLNDSLSEEPQERTYTTKHGTQAVMKTGNIGKKPEPQTPVETPFEPVAQVEPQADNKMSAAEMDDALEVSVDELRDTIADLTRINDALAKDDHAKEVVRLQTHVISLENLLSREMDKCAEYQSLNKSYGKWYADLRKATGLESRSEILEFCRQMAKEKAE